MKVIWVLPVVLSLCSMFVHADIIDRSGNIILDSQRNKAAIESDTERQKRAIEEDTVRQINYFTQLIEKNNYEIREVHEPQMLDLRIDLRALERTRNQISYTDYVNAKRYAEERMKGIKATVSRLVLENNEHMRRQGEIRNTAEKNKKQIESGMLKNQDQIEKDRNKNIIDQLLRSFQK